MSSGIGPSFFGALQASLSVLLTIGYGVIASRCNLLKGGSAKDISKLCVRMFLPALLITKVGSGLRVDTIGRFAPVAVWALVSILTSMTLGWVLRKMFKWPSWTTPAICFNNTTALPLLLIKSLETAGVLKDLTMGGEDSASDAVARATSYFLFSSVISNTLTFALGPKLLDDEETPDDYDKEEEEDEQRSESDEEYANPTNNSGRTAEEQEEHETERTTLLPDRIVHNRERVVKRVFQVSKKHWVNLPPWAQRSLTMLGTFLNAPLIGAIIGAVLGLVPAFRKIFFNAPENGGFFKAWLTSSLEDIGDLFAVLQLITVGAKLSATLMVMKKGESSGEVKLIPVLSIFFIRFILWPVLSITVIYSLVSTTNLLGDDPILWFVLMLIPTGPPATKLTAMADVSGADEEDKMAIAKFLAASYAISPLICFAVVGSLKASLALK